MDGVFACPKCGYELKSKGLLAGRQVRCDWCESWIEVPFLPRVPHPHRKRRGTRRSARWLFASWSAISVLALVILGIAASKWMHAHTNLIHEQRISGLLQSAGEDEKAGRLGDAVAELEAALALLRTFEPASSPRIEELSTRRDALIRVEVRAQLAAIEGAPPDEVVGQCITLLTRVSEQPALAEFGETIRERLQSAALRSASDDLAAARDHFEAGRSAEAFRRCEHLARIAEHIDGHPQRQVKDDARAIVTRIAELGGVVIEPVTGQFTFGTPASYTTVLRPLLVDVLLQHGYLTCPDTSPWRSVWETAAPFRVTVEVNEQLSEDYLQSRNRISQLGAKVALRQRETTLWEQLATARTQVPVPKIPAYQAARIGFGDAPVPEYERILYKNAREIVLERFGGAVNTLPNRTKFPTATSPEPTSIRSALKPGTS
ncbi:MAG: hypothetical protein P4L84_25780 [Isosphaeraceae bacterium]|nr:hypothetical protein [Isosphaeraceae bacterium]